MAWERDEAKEGVAVSHVEEISVGNNAGQGKLRFDLPEPRYPLPNRAIPEFQPFDVSDRAGAGFVRAPVASPGTHSGASLSGVAAPTTGSISDVRFDPTDLHTI